MIKIQHYTLQYNTLTDEGSVTIFLENGSNISFSPISPAQFAAISALVTATASWYNPVSGVLSTNPG